jgi:hypothetical protein
VVLAGLPRLKYKLENLRNDHQQLTSRVGVLLEVKRMGRADAVKIIKGVWGCGVFGVERVGRGKIGRFSVLFNSKI